MHDPTPIEDPGHPYRLLVVANETLAAGTESVREVVARRPDGRRLEVLVVAPALWGRLERWTSDDRPRRAAEQRLRGYLAVLAARGIRAVTAPDSAQRFCRWQGHCNLRGRTAKVATHQMRDAFCVARHPAVRDGSGVRSWSRPS